jgi:hypothetical protein
MHVVGAVSLWEQYNEELGMRVYSFGEIHNKPKPKKTPKGACTVSDYITHVCESNPTQVIDIFLEIALRDSKTKKRSPRFGRPEKSASFLFGDVWKKWENCLQHSPKPRPKNHRHPNVRVHETDVRWLSCIEQFYFNISFPLAEIYSYFEKNDGHIPEKMTNEVSEYVQPRIDKIKTMRKDYKTWESFFGKNPDVFTPLKIQKQIESIRDPKLQREIDILLADIRFQVSHVPTLKELNQFLTSWSKYCKNTGTKRKFLEELTNICDRLDTPFADLLDAYLIARMFRSFRKVRNRYSKRPKNIITFTGNYHATNLRNMLTSLGFKTVHTTTSSDQCLSLKSFSQPFFA